MINKQLKAMYEAVMKRGGPKGVITQSIVDEYHKMVKEESEPELETKKIHISFLKKGKINTYKVNSLEDYKKKREKKEGLKNLFLEEIGDSKTSSKEMLQNLINALEKSGIKIKGKPEKKKKEKDNK